MGFLCSQNCCYLVLFNEKQDWRQQVSSWRKVQVCYVSWECPGVLLVIPQSCRISAWLAACHNPAAVAWTGSSVNQLSNSTLVLSILCLGVKVNVEFDSQSLLTIFPSPWGVWQYFWFSLLGGFCKNTRKSSLSFLKREEFQGC